MIVLDHAEAGDRCPAPQSSTRSHVRKHIGMAPPSAVSHCFPAAQFILPRSHVIPLARRYLLSSLSHADGCMQSIAAPSELLQWSPRFNNDGVHFGVESSLLANVGIPYSIICINRISSSFLSHCLFIHLFVSFYFHL